MPTGSWWPRGKATFVTVDSRGIRCYRHRLITDAVDGERARITGQARGHGDELTDRGRALTVAVVVGVAVNGWGSVGGSLAQAESEVPATNPLSGDAKAIAEGRSWFRAICAICHGVGADGVGERGAAADLRVFNKGFRKFVETVKNGRDVPARTAKMPPWGGVLSDQQIYQIGAYVETLAKDGANWGEPTK